MISLSDIVLLAKKFKWIILLLVVLAVGVGSKVWYNHQITASYSRGVDDTNKTWKVQQDKQNANNVAFKAQQQQLSDNLAFDLLKARGEISDLKKNGGNKQIIYEKSPEGAKVCLDDQAVSIYNDSLGGSE